MKVQVFIRADGSTTIGLGHLVRCSALAFMLKDDFTVTFFCREIPDIMVTELEEKDFRCIRIADANEFFSNITSGSIVVLDGYHFDTDYQKRIKAIGAKLVCIDDLHDKEFVADLIINHAPHITPQNYKTQPYSQFALGLEYALLRPAFLEQAQKQRIIEKIETLLICFGGSDLKNLTQSSLEVALELKEFKKIIVVTGAAYQISEVFDQLTKSDPRINHWHVINEEQMLAVMTEVELAIVPASGILFEALAAGCIVLSGFYTDNQKLVYENFKKSGSIIDCGNFDISKIRNSLKEALTVKRNQDNPIDGKSSSRINKIFNQLQKEFLVSARKALPSDLKITYKWANKSEIRRYSFHQHQISDLEHNNWFINKLNDSNCYFYIFEYCGKQIGSIRFDIKNNEALISYLLDPEYHGRNLGLLLLKKGIERLSIEEISEYHPIHEISGYVMKTNAPSIKAFDRLGFMRIDQGETLKFTKSL
jgi:UDP-2,4-diacetamido-2,4,6-trideoxy-beta-L-altropyranose hydrolase